VDVEKLMDQRQKREEKDETPEANPPEIDTGF
jgi:hypothetical protein